MFENRVRWQIETTNEQFFIWNPGIYFVNDNINHRLTPIYTYYTVPVCIRTLQRKEGCQQSFLSLLRERALCALYLYRSLDIKVTSLHNWVESVTNPEGLKFSLIIGDYWRVPEGSSGEKIISTGELLNFYQNINSTGGFSIPLE